MPITFDRTGGDRVSMRGLLGLTLVAVLFVAGCAAPAMPPVDSSPEFVARRYFELQAAGDSKAARQLMWRPARFDSAVPDNGLVGLTDLRVGDSREDTAANRPDEYRALTEIRELRVEYVRTRADSVGTPPGSDGRFVLLGREARDRPWMVLEIGTGP